MATPAVTREALAEVSLFMGVSVRSVLPSDTGCGERIVDGNRAYCFSPREGQKCTYSDRDVHECPDRKY